MISQELETEYTGEKHFRQKFLLPLIIVVVLMAIAGGIIISVHLQNDDIMPYAAPPVLITGLTENDFTITPQQLLELKCEQVCTNGGINKSAGVNGIGPDLSTFLAQYGRLIDEFKKICFIFSDHNTVVLKREYLS